MSLPIPPPQNSVPASLWPQYRQMLADYYNAMAVGNQVAMRTAVQEMQRLTSISGQLREMLRGLMPMIRPALMAAGAAWSTVTVIMGEVGTFIAGIGAAMLSAEFLIFMVAILILVLLYWWSMERWKQQMRDAGATVSVNVTPQTGFPPNAAQAAQLYRAAAGARGVGPLEVLERRARWEAA